MSSFNQVVLLGNVTRDPQTRQAGGSSVTEFGLATNRKYKPANSNEYKEEVTFVDLSAWGKTGELIQKYITKGSPIFVQGRLKLDQWEKDGQKRSKLSVVVENFQFVGGKQNGGGGGSGGGGSPVSGDEHFKEDDIPF